MIRIYDSFTSDFLYPDINNTLVFFENHDTERWNEIFNANPDAYKMALTLISTVRGIPQIYYGSEIGMRGDKKLVVMRISAGIFEEAGNLIHKKTLSIHPLKLRSKKNFPVYSEIIKLEKR